MSRRRKLINIAMQEHLVYEPSLFLDNLTKPMLANDYVRSLGVAGNAILLKSYKAHRDKVYFTNITRNY